MNVIHSWTLRTPPTASAPKEPIIQGAANTVKKAWSAAFDAAADVIHSGRTAPFDAVVDEREAMIVPARDRSGAADVAESLTLLADLRYVVTS